MKLNISKATKHKAVMVLTPALSSLAWSIAKLNIDQMGNWRPWLAGALVAAVQASAFVIIGMTTADKIEKPDAPPAPAAQPETVKP